MVSTSNVLQEDISIDDGTKPQMMTILLTCPLLLEKVKDCVHLIPHHILCLLNDISPTYYALVSSLLYASVPKNVDKALSPLGWQAAMEEKSQPWWLMHSVSYSLSHKEDSY